MSLETREERRLMRMRGAGVKELQNPHFAFVFGSSSAESSFAPTSRSSLNDNDMPNGAPHAEDQEIAKGEPCSMSSPRVTGKRKRMVGKVESDPLNKRDRTRHEQTLGKVRTKTSKVKASPAPTQSEGQHKERLGQQHKSGRKIRGVAHRSIGHSEANPEGIVHDTKAAAKPKAQRRDKLLTVKDAHSTVNGISGGTGLMAEVPLKTLEPVQLMSRTNDNKANATRKAPRKTVPRDTCREAELANAVPSIKTDCSKKQKQLLRNGSNSTSPPRDRTVSLHPPPDARTRPETFRTQNGIMSGTEVVDRSPSDSSQIAEAIADHKCVPPDTVLSRALRNAVEKCFFEDNLESVTVLRIRAAVERELNLDSGFFKTHKSWKAKSKKIITEEAEKQESIRNDARFASPGAQPFDIEVADVDILSTNSDTHKEMLLSKNDDLFDHQMHAVNPIQSRDPSAKATMSAFPIPKLLPRAQQSNDSVPSSKSKAVLRNRSPNTTGRSKSARSKKTVPLSRRRAVPSRLFDENDDSSVLETNEYLDHFPVPKVPASLALETEGPRLRFRM